MVARCVRGRAGGTPVRLGAADARGMQRDFEVMRDADRPEIGIAVAMKIPRHFLQRDDVGPLEASGNAFRIKTAVETDAVLDVVAQKLHDIL